jgi:NAD+ diphosphatase
MCGFYAEAESRECAVGDELEEVRWYTVDELDTAVMEDSVRLSPPVSIAFRLLADWYNKKSGKDLEQAVRKARGLRRL